MNKLELKFQFKNMTTKVRSQLNYIWSNVPRNECESSVLEAHWPDFHKPIYITFKLRDIIKFLIFFIKDNILWHSHIGRMAKYGKDEKKTTKICNCSRHVKM
jgi:hypothetical protein